MKHAGLPFRLARAPAMRIRFMYYKELRSAPACPCEKKKRLPLDATEGAHARYAHVSTLFHRDAVWTGRRRPMVRKRYPLIWVT